MKHFEVINNDFNRDSWNAVAFHPVQSWQWGEVRKKTGTEVIRIGEFEDETLIKGYQFTLHPLPLTHKKVGYLAMSDFPSDEALQYIKTELAKLNVIHVSIESAKERKEINQQILMREDLKLSRESVFYRDTLVLDLTKDEETLLSNMKQKTRYNIRLASKKGVEIRKADNEADFEKYVQLYFETTQRQNYFGRSKDYQKIVWDCLKEDIATILIAYYNNIPLAAFELFYFNDVMYYCFGGSTQLHKNVMAPNLLMWESILYAKKLGAKKFDMWGATPPHKTDGKDWGGFTRFKEGYGGEFLELTPGYDLVINSWFYRLFLIAQRGKRFEMTLKKLLKR